MATGEATIRAIYPAARNPYAFPELHANEGLEAWTVPETWVMGHPHAARHVRGHHRRVPRKMAALRRHTSQTAHMVELEDMLRGWSVRMAALGGLPEGRLAEAFNVYPTG